MGNLEELYLSYLPPGDEIFAGLMSKLTEKVRVDLIYNSNANIPNFNSLNNLEMFSLNSCMIKLPADGTFKGLSNLKQLDLNDNDIRTLPEKEHSKN